MEIDPYSQELIKDLVGRTLGPTADYIGNEIKELVEFRVENIKRILEATKRKLKRGQNPSEGVHPRVLREVLNTGSFSSDTLWADYFGGVLASSTSEDSRDDRGIVYHTLIGRLSRYELRLHCTLYLAVQQLAVRSMEEWSEHTQLEDKWRLHNAWTTLQKRLFIPAPNLISAMGFGTSEEGMESDILREAVASLARELLIDIEYHIVPESGHRSSEDDLMDWSINKSGYVFRISDQGISLFMWALGLGRSNRNDFLLTDVSKLIPDGILILDSVETIYEKSRRDEFVTSLRYGV